MPGGDSPNLPLCSLRFPNGILRVPQEQPRPVQEFLQLDKNGDGRLSFEEFEQAGWRLEAY